MSHMRQDIANPERSSCRVHSDIGEHLCGEPYKCSGLNLKHTMRLLLRVVLKVLYLVLENRTDLSHHRQQTLIVAELFCLGLLPFLLQGS